MGEYGWSQNSPNRTHTRTHTQYIYRHTYVLPKGFEAESFPLKFNPPTIKYKIHTVKVDLYYFKYL